MVWHKIPALVATIKNGDVATSSEKCWKCLQVLTKPLLTQHEWPIIMPPVPSTSWESAKQHLMWTCYATLAFACQPWTYKLCWHFYIVSWCSCLSTVRQGKGFHQIFVEASNTTDVRGRQQRLRTPLRVEPHNGRIYNALLRPMVTWGCSAVIVDVRENMVHMSLEKHVSFSLSIL